MREKTEKTQKLEQSFWNKVAERADLRRDTFELCKAAKEDVWFGKSIKFLGNIRGKRILDCGCGPGHLCIFLALKNASVYGFDISSEMLKVARANALKNGIGRECNFLCCAFEDLPYRDISFDLAVGAYILHHVDVERAVRELHRVLKP